MANALSIQYLAGVLGRSRARAITVVVLSVIGLAAPPVGARAEAWASEDGPEGVSGGVKVAFLEVWVPKMTRRGECAKGLEFTRLELEHGGRFAHVAIETAMGWLHAHPSVGVTIERNLAPYGTLMKIIRLDRRPLAPEQVASWLTRAYDHDHVWANEDKTDCTKLVAQLLGIAPHPEMRFAADIWERSTARRRVKDGVAGPGLSPDELFQAVERLPRLPWP